MDEKEKKVINSWSRG